MAWRESWKWIHIAQRESLRTTFLLIKTSQILLRFERWTTWLAGIGIQIPDSCPTSKYLLLINTEVNEVRWLLLFSQFFMFVGCVSWTKCSWDGDAKPPLLLRGSVSRQVLMSPTIHVCQTYEQKITPRLPEKGKNVDISLSTAHEHWNPTKLLDKSSLPSSGSA